jgi:uncharacterized protein YpmB
MTRYAKARSDRIDTTVSQVVVVQGSDGVSNESLAAKHVRDQFPGAQVLAIWRTGERVKGQPVYNVEWADEENTDA